MISADATPYATTVSGYVITFLLGIIMVGGGYVIRSLSSAISDLTDEIRKLKDETVGPMKEDIAVIKSKQEHDIPSKTKRKRRR